MPANGSCQGLCLLRKLHFLWLHIVGTVYPFWVSRLCAAVHAAKSDGNMADQTAFCQVHVTLECGCDCCMHRVPISGQAWLMLQVVPMTLQHVVQDLSCTFEKPVT